MKNNFKILIIFLSLAFLGVYLTFLFADIKKSEWLGLYFVNPKNEALDFIIENNFKKVKNCKVEGIAGDNIFFKKLISLKPFEAKKTSIASEKCIKGKKNSIVIDCGGVKKEIYKYIK